MRRDRKIGLVSLLALVILSLLTLYFYYIWGTYTIHAEFDNSSGLSRYDDVSMAGIRIGTVWNLYLGPNRKVHAVLFIRNRYRDFIPVDSTARIISSNPIVGGTSSVDIRPGFSSLMLSQQDYLLTEKTVEFSDLIARVDTLTGTMQTSFAAIDDLLGDPEVVTALRQSALNMEIAARETAALISNLEGTVSDNQTRIPRILAKADTTASNFEALSRNLRLISECNAPVLEQTARDVGAAARDFRAVSHQLKAVVDGVSPTEVHSTLKSVRSASSNIEVVSSRLRSLSEDPSLSAQAKTMLTDLQQALSGAADVVAQVEKLLAEGGSGASESSAPK